MSSPPADPGSLDPFPPWLPVGLKFDALPQPLKHAVTNIINPAYRELVTEAPTALERTVGLSYMHLIWLELLDQFNLGILTVQPTSGPQISFEFYDLNLRAHLRLVTAKD